MNRPVLLDGAIGTELWALAEQKGVKKVPVWVYNLEQPELVQTLAQQYADAGAELIHANTFGANELSVTHASSYETKKVVYEGVRLVKEALDGQPVSVNLDVGPLAVMMEPLGKLSKARVSDIYCEVFEAGLEAGADGITLMTFMDLEMLRVAASAAKRFGVPVLTAMTFERAGRTIFGNRPSQIAKVLGEIGVDAIGINCSAGPEEALKVLKAFREASELPLVFKPNAGRPVVQADGTVTVNYSPEQFVSLCEEALPYASYIGACCGSNPDFIRAMRERLDQTL